jgi:hypothetical protein
MNDSDVRFSSLAWIWAYATLSNPSNFVGELRKHSLTAHIEHDIYGSPMVGMTHQQMIHSKISRAVRRMGGRLAPGAVHLFMAMDVDSG